MLKKMIDNMERTIVAYSKKGFNIPNEEMAILNKWEALGAISFKSNGYGLQKDLYRPLLEDSLWRDVYYKTWYKCFRELIQKHNVSSKLGHASLQEYMASSSRYKFYPVISSRLEDFDKDLEEDLLKTIA